MSLVLSVYAFSYPPFSRRISAYTIAWNRVWGATGLQCIVHASDRATAYASYTHTRIPCHTLYRGTVGCVYQLRKFSM